MKLHAPHEPPSPHHPPRPRPPPRSGHRARGRAVLARLRGTDDVGAEFEDICTAADESNQVSTLASYRALFSAGCRPMLIVTTLIAMLQQLTGINAIMFYVSRLCCFLCWPCAHAAYPRAAAAPAVPAR